MFLEMKSLCSLIFFENVHTQKEGRAFELVASMRVDARDRFGVVRTCQGPPENGGFLRERLLN